MSVREIGQIVPKAIIDKAKEIGRHSDAITQAVKECQGDRPVAELLLEIRDHGAHLPIPPGTGSESIRVLSQQAATRYNP